MKLTGFAFSFLIAQFLVLTPAGVRAADKAPAAKAPAPAVKEPAPAAKEPAPAAKEPAPAAKEADAKPAAKEVTLKGTMMCAKCSLKEADKCGSVLKVGKGKKEAKYYLSENAVAKENHGPICSGEKKATVTGSVSEADGKKLLAASAIKYE